MTGRLYRGGPLTRYGPHQFVRVGYRTAVLYGPEHTVLRYVADAVSEVLYDAVRDPVWVAARQELARQEPVR